MSDATTGFTGPDLGDDAIEVVVVDDLELARRRIVVALEVDDGVEVVASVGTLAAGLSAVSALAPDVVVVALATDDDEAELDLVRRFRALSPGVDVVVVATPDDDADLGRLLGSGVAGIVGRDDPPSSVLAGVRTVADGGLALTPVAAGALSDLLGGGAGRGLHRPLGLLAAGLDPEAVAAGEGCTVDALARRLRASLMGMGPPAAT